MYKTLVHADVVIGFYLAEMSAEGIETVSIEQLVAYGEECTTDEICCLISHYRIWEFCEDYPFFAKYDETRVTLVRQECDSIYERLKRYFQMGLRLEVARCLKNGYISYKSIKADSEKEGEVCHI